MSRSRVVVPVALAFLLALGLGLFPRGALASSGVDEAPDADVITTVLYPGWNLVGWVGPDTPTSDLFDAIPALRQVWVWDAEAQSYQLALRDQQGDLPALTLGMGLWLRLGGRSSYEWRRAASDQGVLLDLRTGQNLLGWTGEDGAGVADTLARFGDDLMEVWHWDAERQRYVPHPPGSDASRLATLARGQALRIELARDTRWWEPGTARPTFVFADDITAEQREEVQALFESATDVFAMRFGAHTTNYTVDVSNKHSLCAAGGGVIDLPFPRCRTAVPHEYFHILQGELMGRGFGAPAWMNEGSAEYAQLVYEQHAYPEQASRHRNPRLAVQKLTITPGEVRDVDRRHPHLLYALGFIAAEWLVDRAGEEAIVDFYRIRKSHDRWEDAFRTAFGIEVDDFYEAVEVYRHERAPLYPHLTDGRIEPVVASLSDAASQAATKIRDEVSEISEFYEGRFGGPAVEYTLYVVDAEAFPSTFVNAFGQADQCLILMPITNSMTIVPGCEIPGPIFTYYVPRRDGSEKHLASNHFNGMLDRLAPPLSTVHLRTDAEIHCIWGIFWLCRGVPEYAAIRYDAHTGAADLDDLILGQIRLALNTPRALNSFEGTSSHREEYRDTDDPTPMPTSKSGSEH